MLTPVGVDGVPEALPREAFIELGQLRLVFLSKELCRERTISEEVGNEPPVYIARPMKQRSSVRDVGTMKPWIASVFLLATSRHPAGLYGLSS